jgi:predicted RNase H-like HicB family nuclease
MFDLTAHWDPDARVWWAESPHIPGLATEAGTLEKLEGNVLDVAPELVGRALHRVGVVPRARQRARA